MDYLASVFTVTVALLPLQLAVVWTDFRLPLWETFTEILAPLPIVCHLPSQYRLEALLVQDLL